MTEPFRPRAPKEPHEYVDADFLQANSDIFGDALKEGGSCVQRYGVDDLAMRAAARDLCVYCVSQWSVGSLRLSDASYCSGFANYHYVQGPHDAEMQKKDSAIFRGPSLAFARKHLPSLKDMERLIHSWAEARPEARGRKAITCGVDALRQRGMLSAGRVALLASCNQPAPDVVHPSPPDVQARPSFLPIWTPGRSWVARASRWRSNCQSLPLSSHLGQELPHRQCKCSVLASRSSMGLNQASRRASPQRARTHRRPPLRTR